MAAQTPSPVAATTQTTRLLACGILAGPLFLAVWLLQALTRDGFDPSRHPLSLLSLGELGWIQIANFVVTGLLYVACAVGMWRVLHPGRSGTWGPVLVGGFGVGLRRFVALKQRGRVGACVATPLAANLTDQPSATQMDREAPGNGWEAQRRCGRRIWISLDGLEGKGEGVAQADHARLRGTADQIRVGDVRLAWLVTNGAAATRPGPGGRTRRRRPTAAATGRTTSRG
jgi:hypothetical protein